MVESLAYHISPLHLALTTYITRLLRLQIDLIDRATDPKDLESSLYLSYAKKKHDNDLRAEIRDPDHH